MKNVAELFRLDYRSLALYRVLLGCVLLYDIAARALEVAAFYTDGGVLPRAPLVEQFQSEWSWSLHLLSGASAVQYVLFALAAVGALALIVGYRTRVATLVSLVLLISLHNRNPLVLSSSDQLMRVLLFWTLFLPVGAAYSFDRARKGAAAAALSRPSNASVGTAAFILQICLVYWFTAALKSDRAWWHEGSALYYAFNIDYLTTDLGRVMLTFPGALRALSYLSIWLEAVGPALLFFPRKNGAIRTAVVFAFILFHLCMTPFLTLGTFPFVCAAMWSSLLPAEFWERVGKNFGRLDGWAARSGAPAVARTPAWMNVVAGVFFVYVLFWNFGPVTAQRVGVPARVGWIGQVTGLAQAWRMFSPVPKKDDGWYVIPAKLRGGAEVDLFRNGAPVDWAKPDSVVALYPNSYWQKYTENIWLRDFASARLHYARYLCRTWNAAHGGDEELRTFDIVYMREDTPPPGQPVPVAEPVIIWQHDCFK
ncbi:MAG TPA: HTTM domain-containing protein [Pyrinomonadaceae bacterium]